ncbi:MAG: hypothetical protein CO029_03005 [Candidatus Magasanikbacteria bacterium CG_4_9_14_0_2_um_filter_41_10]|uniref:Uncharacterized protein n=1 Tax=Candidatus Magasanikbacteria bacterium CG_4_10_14_0_2_um_filter_41_31 TaxID=1974639 RepID=A0A2M7V259_9BACT|nr:MAG: hypothetical protein COX83_04110 [Candidatus Magasanikbacteria bacterium CG_4_10_14_0_2_um_filter_41_31]PJC53379.1 MAG: hypothetical protein CO029_03005 [Candidatus Magasanikbacteria bacterium CG_4_9_14_0_2_um_filter_41_10]
MDTTLIEDASSIAYALVVHPVSGAVGVVNTHTLRDLDVRSVFWVSLQTQKRVLRQIVPRTRSIVFAKEETSLALGNTYSLLKTDKVVLVVRTAALDTEVFRTPETIIAVGILLALQRLRQTPSSSIKLLTTTGAQLDARRVAVLRTICAAQEVLVGEPPVFLLLRLIAPAGGAQALNRRRIRVFLRVTQTARHGLWVTALCEDKDDKQQRKRREETRRHELPPRSKSL